MNPQDEPISEPRAFANFITEIEAGALHDDISRSLQVLVSKVKETARAGSMTIKIDLKPEGEVITVQGTIKVTPPKEARRKSVFFTDDSGNLRRDNPRQSDLPLMVVEAKQTPLKAV